MKVQFAFHLFFGYGKNNSNIEKKGEKTGFWYALVTF